MMCMEECCMKAKSLLTRYAGLNGSHGRIVMMFYAWTPGERTFSSSIWMPCLHRVYTPKARRDIQRCLDSVNHYGLVLRERGSKLCKNSL
jgi:hypothetical protein